MDRKIIIRDDDVLNYDIGLSIMCPFRRARIEADISCSTRCAWFVVEDGIRVEDPRSAFCGKKFIGVIIK